jgi:hypothetical protein
MFAVRKITVSTFGLNTLFNNGSIAQLVQSICLTSRGSQVRILLLPQQKAFRLISKGFFVFITF